MDEQIIDGRVEGWRNIENKSWVDLGRIDGLVNR